MNYTERIDGYQIRDVTYIGMPPKDAPPMYDIVKWNTYDTPTRMLSLDTGKYENVTEYCFSVGTLVWNPKEPCFEFESVGLRWLEAKPSEAVVDMVLKFAEEKAKELEAEDD